jgi:hypothetical protein
MAFEITLKPPFSLPQLLRAQREEPKQEYHWLGKTRAAPKSKTGSRDQDRQQPGRKGGGKYRPLSSIRLGEVEEALSLFERQIRPAHENWIGKNHFSSIPLKRIKDGRPPLIFGRVAACYPSDGYLDNIEELELYFPRREGLPDLVHLRRDEISRYSRKSVESYYLRVLFKASGEDAADFAEAESLFTRNGYSPELDGGYHELLEMNDMNQSAYPWLYLIGSRWFAEAPDSLYPDLLSKLRQMLQWGKHIFNYHPDWLPMEVNTLNKALGFKYGFTPTVLTEPGTPQETAFIVAKIFERDVFPGAKVNK